MPTASSGSPPSRSTTRWRRGTPSTSLSRSPSTRGSASWSGRRWPAAWSPASTGATRRPRGQTRQLSGEWNEPPVRDRDKLYDTIEVLVEVAGAHGASPAQVALAWLLGRPAVTSLIIGARTDEQLADNLAAAGLTLTADERAALDKVSLPDLVYPHWHQLATATDRLGPADLALLGQHLREV